MARPAPTMFLAPNLDWSHEWPDQPGWWWFSYLLPGTDRVSRDAVFAQFVNDNEIKRKDLRFDILHISQMTPQRWKEEQWVCAPVVLYKSTGQVELYQPVK